MNYLRRFICSFADLPTITESKLRATCAGNSTARASIIMAIDNAASITSAQTGIRAEVDKSFSQVSQLYKQAMAPVRPEFVTKPTNDTPPAMGDLLHDLRKMGFSDVETLISTFYSSIQGVQNDNELLLERLVTLLSKLPANSKQGKSLTDNFVNQLWNGLPHPPPTSLGTEFKYRSADGSGNNINSPDLGKAETPYARSAKPETMQQIGLPDPADIFDSIMDRGDKFEPHPNGVSSMLFYQASIIIHDLFRTVSLVM